MVSEDEAFMREALGEARMAYGEGEVPVGAVIVRGGQIVARGHNRREARQNALSHAEAEAIGAACRALHSWRLSECTLYVTLEPCPMCAGAILNARVGRVVYGALDPAAGACGSVADLFAMPFRYEPAVRSGVLEAECAALLSRFFAALRRTDVPTGAGTSAETDASAEADVPAEPQGDKKIRPGEPCGAQAENNRKNTLPGGQKL